MKLTDALKTWLIDAEKATAESTDDEFRKATAAALVDGSLTHDKMAELLVSKEEKVTDEKATDLADQLKAMTAGLGEAVELMKAMATKPNNDGATASEETDPKKEADVSETKEAKTETKDEPGEVAKMVASIGSGLGTEIDGRSIDVRVKEAAKQYSTTKSAMVYPEFNPRGRRNFNAGQPVMDFSGGEGHDVRALDVPSQLDKAVVGAWAKFLCSTARLNGSKTFGFQALPQHDRELIYYAMQKMQWSGASDGGDRADILNRFLDVNQQKALIDDAVSGGLEAAPIVFDDDVIQRPLLTGELFPLVNLVPLDRGRRIEGVSIGTVTGTWGGVDDSNIPLFNTNSYVSAFDTTIFRWEGSIAIGLDFLSDSPINFGQIISTQYGERLKEDLDDVIAAGNGTTQPEGIINKSGSTSITFSSATTLGNYESLRFGVAKNEHQATRGSAVFCGTETSYRRARAIPVGASDARRIFGMDYDSYALMERPFKINESLTNLQIFYAIMERYRMYRRRGLTIRTSTEGQTLMRLNELLMVAMARYGGQQERGATVAITTDAPA